MKNNGLEPINIIILIDTYEEEIVNQYKGFTQTLKKYIKKHNNGIKGEITEVRDEMREVNESILKLTAMVEGIQKEEE